MKDQSNKFELEVDREVLERNLVFLASFGLNDELRDGVADCISKLAEKMINVRMISGDNIYTAIECAKKAGILVEGEDKVDKSCMTGK